MSRWNKDFCLKESSLFFACIFTFIFWIIFEYFKTTGLQNPSGINTRTFSLCGQLLAFFIDLQLRTDMFNEWGVTQMPYLQISFCMCALFWTVPGCTSRKNTHFTIINIVVLILFSSWFSARWFKAEQNCMLCFMQFAWDYILELWTIHQIYL